MPAPQAAVVIPAFNEVATIAWVVRAVLCHGLVIVVDDGSGDATAAEATRAGAMVVRHERNCGYDAALDSGLQAALEHGAAWAVTLDADGQHDPQDLCRMLELLRGGTELVLGCREHAHRWSEALFNAWARVCYGVPDILCGFKGYSAGLILAAGLGGMGRSIGTGLALWGLRHKVKTGLVAVQISPRQGRSRLGSSLRANGLILRALLAALTGSWRGPGQAPRRQTHGVNP